ncbi:HTH-type transcriptional regulator KipR [bioreactor metagenome]|uniref:HTH-type transcriptional regulator KipR n=1 Tax=bioreactor metagenome TaxID=1076179 RepID=A0A645H099_9ZZZZ
MRKAGGTRYDLSFGMLGAVRKLTDRNACYEAMTPVLEELAAATGLCCKLSVRQGEFQIPILRAESPRPMAVSGKVGVRFPVAEGSVGAALLAESPAAELERLGRLCAEATGCGDAAELLRDGAAAIRKNGYCFNRGRNRWRIDAMSVPLRDAEHRVVAALTLLGYDEDFSDERLPAVVRMLSDGAKKCEKIYHQQEQELC